MEIILEELLKSKFWCVYIAKPNQGPIKVPASVKTLFKENPKILNLLVKQISNKKSLPTVKTLLKAPYKNLIKHK